ncbi:MAG: hypothetical protein ACTS27_13075, partial [Phycisphaerales bacterium]
DALAAELARSGIEVTQATLSRDLRELGVLKGPAGYVLPGGVQVEAVAEPTSAATIASEAVRRVVRRYVRTVRCGVGQVVIKTDPGHAQVVALELDRFPPAGVIGTVGGDDTIFVAVDDAARVRTLANELIQLAGNGPAEGRTL